MNYAKKIFTVIALLVCTYVNADWKDQWTLAVQFCHENNFSAAEEKFNACIEEMELQNDCSAPYVYVDRARLYLIQEKYALALKDLDKAMSNPNLTKKELTRALVSRISAKSKLGISDGVLNDLDAMSKSLPAQPTMEFTKKFIIIRNSPDNECYRNIVSQFLIKAKYCKKESDIKILKNGTWIIERTGDSNCGCDNKTKKSLLASEDKPNSCIEWCDYMAIAGAAWCGKAFKRYDCQVGCCTAVEFIKRNICYPCCRSGDFYKDCIKPFEDIVAYMGNPCDPYFD